MENEQDSNRLQKICDALRRNGFSCECFKNRAETIEYLFQSQLRDVSTIGMGGSLTLAELGLENRCKSRGIKIVSRDNSPVAWNEDGFREYIRQFFLVDLYMCSANAITEDGHLVYIDGTGDRVAPLLFGPKHSIVVAGKNKIVSNDTEAVARIKEYVAPHNAWMRKYNTPCAKTGKCVNCKGPNRSCNATVILEQPTRLSNILVLLIDEELGI